MRLTIPGLSSSSLNSPGLPLRSPLSRGLWLPLLAGRARPAPSAPGASHGRALAAAGSWGPKPRPATRCPVGTAPLQPARAPEAPAHSPRQPAAALARLPRALRAAGSAGRAVRLRRAVALGSWRSDPLCSRAQRKKATSRFFLSFCFPLLPLEGVLWPPGPQDLWDGGATHRADELPPLCHGFWNATPAYPTPRLHSFYKYCLIINYIEVLLESLNCSR